MYHHSCQCTIYFSSLHIYSMHEFTINQSINLYFTIVQDSYIHIYTKILSNTWLLRVNVPTCQSFSSPLTLSNLLLFFLLYSAPLILLLLRLDLFFHLSLPLSFPLSLPPSLPPSLPLLHFTVAGVLSSNSRSVWRLIMHFERLVDNGKYPPPPPPKKKTKKNPEVIEIRTSTV